MLQIGVFNKNQQHANSQVIKPLRATALEIYGLRSHWGNQEQNWKNKLNKQNDNQNISPIASNANENEFIFGFATLSFESNAALSLFSHTITA